MNKRINFLLVLCFFFILKILIYLRFILEWGKIKIQYFFADNYVLTLFIK